MMYCPFCGYPLRNGKCFNCGYIRDVGPIEPFIGEDDDD